MAGCVEATSRKMPQISNYMRNNLVTLYTLHPSQKEVESVLRENNLFAVPQKKAMQDVFNFLLPIIFHLKIVKFSESHHKYLWPILNRAEAVKFSTTVRKVLLELVTNHPDAQLPRITASFLTNPGGEKFIFYMWKLTLFLLDKSVQSLRGDRMVKCVHKPHDELIDVKIKIFQSLAVDGTRRYAEKRVEISRLKDAARKAARELVDEIKRTTAQCDEAESRLAVLTSAPVTDDYAISGPAGVEGRRAEVEALAVRVAACQTRLEDSKGKICTALERRCLDGTELRSSVPGAVLVLPGCEGLADSLYTADGRLDLATLTVAGCRAIELLSTAISPEVTDFFARHADQLREMALRATEWDAYLASVELAMAGATIEAERKAERLYERLERRQRRSLPPFDLSLLTSEDMVFEGLKDDMGDVDFGNFELTPDPNRYGGLIRTKGSQRLQRSKMATEKPISPSVESVNKTLDSSFNRSRRNSGRFSIIGSIRPLLERNLNINKSVLSVEQSELSMLSERLELDVLGAIGDCQAHPASVCRLQQHESPEVFFAGADVAANPRSPNITGCLSEPASTPAALSESVDSFLALTLFDSDRSESTTRSVAEDSPLESGGCFATPPTPFLSSRPPLFESPFLAVPEDTPLLSECSQDTDLSLPNLSFPDFSPLLSVGKSARTTISSDKSSFVSLDESSFGDSLSESDIVNFSPFLKPTVLSPPAAMEDITTPLPPSTPVSSRPSLDAIIARYRRIQERANPAQSMPEGD